MNLYDEGYAPDLHSTRALLETHPTTARIVGPDISPRQFERFLIEFCARAVHMTEPVEGWIRRAGEATRAVGLEDIGTQLVKHAKHEAGHHLMLIKDADALADHWNQRGMSPLVDARAITAAPMTSGMRAYVDLHEDTIASEMPFGQVAIELEIENLSVRFGPKLIDQAQRLLGSEVMSRLSFVEEHVEVDVGHTALNEKIMARLLEHRPEMLPALVATGRRALEIYIQFFGECLDASEEHAAAA
ncbi:MAG: iron-containing redox enzyme family protein [Myxococcota bacterium]